MALIPLEEGSPEMAITVLLLVVLLKVEKAAFVKR
jgi:hypothetical protein